MEVNERLHLTAFHLHDHEDDNGNGHGGQGDASLGEDLDELVLPAIGYPVRDEGEDHQGKDILISKEHLGQHVGIELREHLLQHHPLVQELKRWF